MKHNRKSHTIVRSPLRVYADIVPGVFLKETPGGDVSFLQLKDLQLERFASTATKVSYHPKLDKYLLRRGDLLFAGKGTTYLCKVFDCDVKAVPSTTFYYIRPNHSKILPDYLCWYLNHPKVVAAVKAAQTGTGTPLIHKATLEQLEVVVPDLETQQIIVDLSTLQCREAQILKSLAEKKVLLTNQILFNELVKNINI